MADTKAAGGMWLNKQGEAVNYLAYRFASMGGYRFGIPGQWTGSAEQRDKARRQYVNDMRWAKAARRLQEPMWGTTEGER